MQLRLQRTTSSHLALCRVAPLQSVWLERHCEHWKSSRSHQRWGAQLRVHAACQLLLPTQLHHLPGTGQILGTTSNCVLSLDPLRIRPIRRAVRWSSACQCAPILARGCHHGRPKMPQNAALSHAWPPNRKTSTRHAFHGVRVGYFMLRHRCSTTHLRGMTSSGGLMQRRNALRLAATPPRGSLTSMEHACLRATTGNITARCMRTARAHAALRSVHQARWHWRAAVPARPSVHPVSSCLPIARQLGQQMVHTA